MPASWTRVVALVVLCAGLSSAVVFESCDSHADCGTGQHCLFAFDGSERAHGMCFSKLDAKPAQRILSSVAHSALQLGEDGNRPVAGLPGLNVTSLTVNAPEGQSARVVLGSGHTQYSFGVHADGTFVITQGKDKDVFAVNKQGDIVARTKMLAVGAVAADRGFIVDTMPQWALWRSEDFSKGASDWSQSETTQCAGLHLLGGQPSTAKSILSKKFTNLPEHARVRVVATFHFIDLWQGETAYMQLSSGAEGALEYAWTDRYDLKDTEGVLNVCGKDKFGEAKFSVPIDVTIVHSSSELEVAFGSTLTSDSGEAAWGVSTVDVYVRPE